MYSLSKVITTISLIAVTLGCFGLSPQARATCQKDCLPNESTVLGENALLNHSNALNDTAIGFQALFSVTTGEGNTAIGTNVLPVNTTGSFNTADGLLALFNNKTGNNNTAVGSGTLQNLGSGTLETGNFNTAVGANALHNIFTGNSNIALGESAGINLTPTGSDNIDIGNIGVAGESGVIRIGTSGTQTATFIAGIRETPLAQGVALAVGITADGQLGVKASSARFKEAIRPMNKASEAIFSLQPVTFRCKKALDPHALPQFGLVAEQVAKVNPDLVACDAEGKPFTVRYDEVNVMLLNEFQKAHTTISELKSVVAKQQEQIAALASQIKTVSNRLELREGAPRVVASEP